MIRRVKRSEKRKLEEQVVQKFPHRCPYCDRAVSYDAIDLKAGENVIQCISCQRIYIKVVSNVDEKKG